MDRLYTVAVTASLTILDESNVTIEIELCSIFEDRLQIDPVPTMPLGALVKVSRDIRLWLGFVVEGTEGKAEIRIEHFLRDTGELSLLADQFVGIHTCVDTKSTTLS